MHQPAIIGRTERYALGGKVTKKLYLHPVLTKLKQLFAASKLNILKFQPSPTQPNPTQLNPAPVFLAKAFTLVCHSHSDEISMSWNFEQVTLLSFVCLLWLLVKHKGLRTRDCIVWLIKTNIYLKLFHLDDVDMYSSSVLNGKLWTKNFAGLGT